MLTRSGKKLLRMSRSKRSEIRLILARKEVRSLQI